jgi:maltose/moltooligosaccharide transporter
MIENDPSSRYNGVFYTPLVITQLLAWGGMFMLWVFGYLHIRLALHVDEVDAIRWMGLGMALYVALGAGLNFVLPWAHTRIGMIKAHAVALLLGGSGIIVVANANTPVTLLLGYAVTSIGWSSLSNTPYALVSARVKDGRYELAMARFNLSVVVPQIGLALALGWLIGHMPPALAIRYGGVAMIMAGIVALTIKGPAAA